MQNRYCQTLTGSLCLVAQSCPTLCDPMDSSPPGSSVHGDSPGKKTGVDCHSLLQGIFPAEGSNPGLIHCRLSLYHPSHLGSLRGVEQVSSEISLFSHLEPFLYCSLYRRFHFKKFCCFKISEQSSIFKVESPTFPS